MDVKTEAASGTSASLAQRGAAQALSSHPSVPGAWIRTRTQAQHCSWPCLVNLSPSLGKRLSSDATQRRDFRPPKFNSSGGSRKPSAGAGRAEAPGVRRLRGEVPEVPG